MILFDKIISDPSTGHGVDGYYIGENGEYTLYQASKAVGEALVELGKAETAEPNQFSTEECMKYFGVRQCHRFLSMFSLTYIDSGLLPREYLSLQIKPLACHRLEAHEDDEGSYRESEVRGGSLTGVEALACPGICRNLVAEIVNLIV